VDEPVKFIARKEEIDVIIRNQDIISKIFLPAWPAYKRVRKINDPV